MNPLTLICGVGAACLICLGGPVPWASLAVIVVAAATAAGLGILPVLLRSVTVLIGPIALVMFLVQSLTHPGGGGVEVATAMTLRVLALGAACLLIPTACTPYELRTALLGTRLPPQLATIVALTAGLLPVIATALDAIQRAQRQRGVTSLRARVRYASSALISRVLTDLPARADVLSLRTGAAPARTSPAPQTSTAPQTPTTPQTSTTPHTSTTPQPSTGPGGVASSGRTSPTPGSTSPGDTYLLLPDSALQRLLRWALPLGAIALVAWELLR